MGECIASGKRTNRIKVEIRQMRYRHDYSPAFSRATARCIECSVRPVLRQSSALASARDLLLEDLEPERNRRYGREGSESSRTGTAGKNVNSLFVPSEGMRCFPACFPSSRFQNAPGAAARRLAIVLVRMARELPRHSTPLPRDGRFHGALRSQAWRASRRLGRDPLRLSLNASDEPRRGLTTPSEGALRSAPPVYAAGDTGGDRASERELELRATHLARLRNELFDNRRLFFALLLLDSALTAEWVVDRTARRMPRLS